MIRQSMPTWITLLGIIAILAAGHASGSSRPAPPAPARAAVAIDNFNFAPATLTVAVGTTVVWTNRDDVPHTATSTNSVFASPVLDTGESFEFTFQKVGTFPYYCKVHPKMTGQVVVQ